ncbi:MAG: 2,3-diphosphoglycerate-dependent phosphoglycerate mutase [Clostridiales bacterium]
MKKIIFLRHGESTWNKENKFTGWTDVDLSKKGLLEAKDAGIVLRDNSFNFDIAFTSVLKRAIKTLNIVLDELDLNWIPTEKDWRLNERHYGSLQGLNKSDTAKKFGEKQVKIWRRSYDIKPPELSDDDIRLPSKEKKYENIPSNLLPKTESLKITVERVIPFWEEKIIPLLNQNKRIIISAHGNSIRALVKYLDNVSEKNILELNIPTGIPLVYEFDQNLNPLKNYYLGDQEKILSEINNVKNQGIK